MSESRMLSDVLTQGGSDLDDLSAVNECCHILLCIFLFGLLMDDTFSTLPNNKSRCTNGRW